MKTIIPFLIITFFILNQSIAQTDVVPIDKTKPVGTTSGSVDVSPTGAATYTIPIFTPPGTAGMQPQLSIVYNSQGGNGLLGMGWDLAGLSAISRIPKPIDSSNAVIPITFAELFIALDGNRLESSGGVEYHTEKESQITVRRGYNDFTAFTNDGKRLEYGMTPDSKSELVWMLNKLTDKDSNYIIFMYNKLENNELRIHEINYTGNVKANILPYNKIVFNYTSRTDKSFAYVNGRKSARTSLLQSIEVFSEGSLVRKYTFYYEQGVCSRLVKIEEAANDGSVLNPTVINWESETPSLTVTNVSIQLPSVDYSHFYYGDFNGDGKTDLVTVPKKTFAYTTADKWSLYLATGNENTPFTKVAEGSLVQAFKPEGVQVADFNGDGLDDMLWPRMGGAFYDCMLSTGNSFSYGRTCSSGMQESDVFVGNFSGRGKAEVLTVYKASPGSTMSGKYEYSWILSQCGDGNKTFTGCMKTSMSTEKRFVTDINGNGKSDFLVLDEILMEAFEFDGTEFKLVPQYTYANGERYILPGDFNGDGKTDFLKLNCSSNPEPENRCEWSLLFATGGEHVLLNGTVPLSTDYFNPTEFEQRIHIVDMNGDGKSDILELRGDSIHTYYSYGNGEFFKESAYFPNSGMAPGNVRSFADFNGDGRGDFFLYNINMTYPGVNFLFFHKNELVNRIQNGKGISVSFTYKSLANAPGVYTKGSGAIFPYIDLQCAMFVVSALMVPDGAGGVDTTRYTYEGAKLHRLGFGFMGFEKTIVSHTNSNLKTINTYQIKAIPYHSYPVLIKSENTTCDGRPINTSVYTNKELFYYFPTDQRHFFPYISNTLVTNHLDNISINTSFEYNRSGNLTKRITSTIDNGSVEATEKLNIYYVAETSNDIASTQLWKKVQNDSILYKTNFLYYPDERMHLKWKAESIIGASTPGSPAITTEYKDYNLFGIPTQIKTYSNQAGSEVFVTSAQYDSKGRFATSQTNALGHTSYYNYEPKFGNLLSETDPNGLTTNYQYDVWGRRTQTTFPDGTTATQSANWYDGNPIPNALYYTELLATAAPPVYTFYDALDREVCTYTRSDFEGAQNMYADTRYNAKGQVEKKSLPYRSVNTAESQKQWAAYTYDEIGRLTKETGPMLHKTYSYAPRQITVTDVLNGNSAYTTTTNSLGQAIEATDPGGSITYAYNVQGLPVTTKVNGQAVATMQYDYMGNRTSITEPNSGTTTSKYDAFGRLIKQTHARGDSILFAYDLLGRITQKLVNGDKYAEGSARYYYDQDKLGLVYRVESENHTTDYVYDNLCRKTAQTETILGESYTTRYEYDSQGQISKLIYPGGFYVTYQYNWLGELHVIRNPHNHIIWSMTKKNVLGQPTQYHWGEGRTTLLDYDSYGNLTGIRSGLKTANGGGGMNTNSFSGFIPGISDYPEMASSSISCNGEIQTWNYSYYERGLLHISECGITQQYEKYAYDGLNRLSGIFNDSYSKEISYDNSGNIQTQSHLGGYSYGSAKPHAVTAVDPAASLSSSWECNTSYTPFNKIKQIAKGDTTLTFTYGNAQQRIFTVESVLSRGKSRTFVSKFFEVEKRVNAMGNPYKNSNYIYAGNQLVGIYVQDVDGMSWGNPTVTKTMYYVHTDRLGSYDVITDSVGTILDRLSFDAWGNRRNPASWEEADTNVNGHLFNRGYTGHEHLDKFGIINMNGRLYDPVVARFFSPDPYVQMPNSTQNYNRYSYCLNNPLMYADPSGEIFGLISKGLDFLSIPARVLSDATQWVNDQINGERQEGGYFKTSYLSGKSSPYPVPTEGIRYGYYDHSTFYGTGSNGFTAADDNQYVMWRMRKSGASAGGMQRQNADGTWSEVPGKPSEPQWKVDWLQVQKEANLNDILLDYPWPQGGQTHAVSLADPFVELAVDIVSSGLQGFGVGIQASNITGTIVTAAIAVMVAKKMPSISSRATSGGAQGIKSLGAAGKGFSRTLQTGGHTLNNSTLKALKLTKEQGKMAIEALKKAEGLPNNAHFKILYDGSVINPHTGVNYGRLFDYLP